MKVKSLIAGAAVAAIVPVASVAGPVFANSPGQIDGGDIYRIKNLTQNSTYADSASATCNDELQYKVLLHNSRFGAVENVTAKATLPANGGTSNMVVTYDSPGPRNSVSASASLDLKKGSVSYESGSSQLLDGNNNVIKALPDGITDGGVNTGTLAGSTAEFVTFKAKVTCAPTPPPCETNCTPKPPVTPPVTPPTTTTTTTTPTTLVNTGPGDVIGAFAAATVAGTFAYRLYLSRRLARQ